MRDVQIHRQRMGKGEKEEENRGRDRRK